MLVRAVTTAIGVIILLAQVLAAHAAEVKILAGGAISGVLHELGPRFECATGHKLVIQYGLSHK
jgi:molybdate transport system substrate-binding protein